MKAQLFQRLLFVMPDDEETYIAAMAAVFAYVGKLNMSGIRTDVHLAGRETWLSDLLVPPGFCMHESVADAMGNDTYDLAVELTQERAVQLANATSQSCATGFGYLLGLAGIGELVRINGLSEPQYDIGVVWWGETAQKFYNSLSRVDYDAKICMLPSVRAWAGQRSLGDSDYAAVLDCALLVGMRSPLTYLAACAGRAVIELYPTDEYEKSFFAKWSSNNYWMMLLENRQAIEQNYGTLWRSFERIWGQIGRARRRRVLQPAVADATP
jgi:hypothetical protein